MQEEEEEGGGGGDGGGEEEEEEEQEIVNGISKRTLVHSFNLLIFYFELT